MIRINQLKLSVGHTKADMKKKAAKMMRIPEDKILSLVPVRQSLDARKIPKNHTGFRSMDKSRFATGL